MSDDLSVMFLGEALKRLCGSYWDDVAKALGVEPRGYSPRRDIVIWPVDEIIQRRKIGLSVAERLRRFNPGGIEEGSLPRGWHRKPPARRWDMDVITLAEFKRRYGRAAVAKLPPGAIIKPHGAGRRKCVTGQAVQAVRGL